MDFHFSQVSNETVNTIIQSIDLDEYESEYGEIIKVYADWVNEMLQV